MDIDDYEKAVRLIAAGVSFDVFLAGAMRTASVTDQARLAKAFPDAWKFMVDTLNSGHTPDSLNVLENICALAYILHQQYIEETTVE